MKISISATNACHLYQMALALHARGSLGRFYSGYPKWRLQCPNDFPCETHSLRTILTYAANRFPLFLRPNMDYIFAWQDRAFDQWAASVLENCRFMHTMPGQALATFRRARELGIRCVLNHATSPIWRQHEAVADEYRRVGLNSPTLTDLQKRLTERHRQEYALADYHCVASSIVRDRLVEEGIRAETIWTIPYAADWKIFFPPPEGRKTSGFRIVFAGQLALRKGIKYLLDALAIAQERNWRLDCYGVSMAETTWDRANYHGAVPVAFHGPVSHKRLADIFRQSSILVLPSLEDGFGLVVAQALACGLPCLVTEQVGAKDLIRHHVNGSIVPAKNPEALYVELAWWSSHRPIASPCLSWKHGANLLVERSLEAAVR